MSDEQWLGMNRRWWNERVPLHRESDFYRVGSLRAGGDTLLPFESTELDDVRGRGLVHLQCHIATDTLAWARRGATVVGVDSSSTRWRTSSTKRPAGRSARTTSTNG